MASATRSVPALAWQQIRRIGPLGSIILLHIGFFYALQSGLLRQATQALPQEVFASFITPEPAPRSSVATPPPAAPKTVPVVKRAPAPPKPVAQAANPATPQQAITPPATASNSSDSAAATAPPTAAAPAQPKTVSGVEYIQAPQPDYPLASKRLGESGTVILRVLVNEKGRAERVEVHKSSGSSRLDEAGRQAALRALFKPHLEDGKPVAVYALVPIKFQLD
jgi:protein TonB